MRTTVESGMLKRNEALVPVFAQTTTYISMNDEDLFEPIDTERTHLRCPRCVDATTIAGLMTPGVSRWLAAWPLATTEQVAVAKILQAREEIAAGQALHFLIERQVDQAVMGWIRVSRAETEAKMGDLGYWLNEAYHHYGYTTEATITAVTAAFERLNLDSVEGGAQVENVASFAVMQRIGMEPQGERIVWASARNRQELCIFYSVTRDQFVQLQIDQLSGKKL